MPSRRPQLVPKPRANQDFGPFGNGIVPTLPLLAALRPSPPRPAAQLPRKPSRGYWDVASCLDAPASEDGPGEWVESQVGAARATPLTFGAILHVRVSGHCQPLLLALCVTAGQRPVATASDPLAV